MIGFAGISMPDPAVALPGPFQTPSAGLIGIGGRKMPEKRDAPYSSAADLPGWAALAGVLHIVGATPRFRQLAGLAGAGGLLQAARPCLHRCCLDSRPELRAAAGEPI
jgi:hypothetical protein